MEDNWPMMAIAAMIAIDKVLGTLKDRGIDLRKMSDEVKDLHIWHSKEDEDGVKIWYVRKTLESAIERLADNIAAQTKILEKMHNDDRMRDRRVEALEIQLKSVM